MIYKHGSFEHDVHLNDVQIVPEYNGLGQLVRTNYQYLIEGKVDGEDQAALKTAIQALESAYLGTQVTETGLLHSDEETESAHYLDISNLDTERGITARVRWVDGGAEYVYKRSFQIAIDCQVLGPGATEYEYSNRIVRIGNGGPVRVAHNTLSGPLIQQVYPASPYFGLETGRKVSRIAAVTVKTPTFPAYTNGHDMHRDIGSDRGPDGITRYFATWTYNLMSTTAF